MNCLYIDGIKTEGIANKYNFIWKKAVGKFSVKPQETIRYSFQEEISPLIEEDISLYEEEWVPLADFLTLLESE